MTARFVTAVGDRLWDLGFPVSLYLITGEPAWVAAAECSKYLLAGLLVPRLPLPTSEGHARTSYLAAVGVQAIGVLVAAAALVAAGTSTSSGLLVVALLAVGCVTLGAKWAEIIMQTRFTSLPVGAVNAIQSDEERRRQEARNYLISPTIRTFAAVLATSVVMGLLYHSRLATRELELVKERIIAILVSINLTTFAIEALIVATLPYSPPREGPSVGASRAPLPRSVTLPIVANLFIWFTVLYPGGNLVSSLHKAEQESRVATDLWILVGLQALGFVSGFLGNLWTVWKGVDRAGRFELYIAGQATFLLASCVFLSQGMYNWFQAALIMSRLFLGVYYPRYLSLLGQIAASEHPAEKEQQKQLYQRFMAFDTLQSHLAIVAASGFYTIALWLLPEQQAFEVAAWVSLGAVSTSSVIWAIGRKLRPM